MQTHVTFSPLYSFGAFSVSMYDPCLLLSSYGHNMAQAQN